MRVKVYSLKSDFINLAYKVSNTQFKTGNRPYVLVVPVNGYEYLIPLTTTSSSRQFYYNVQNQKLLFEKAFPLVNRSIIRSEYNSSFLEAGILSALDREYNNIVRSFESFLRTDYPTRFSLNHKDMINLQKQYK